MNIFKEGDIPIDYKKLFDDISEGERRGLELNGHWLMPDRRSLLHEIEELRQYLPVIDLPGNRIASRAVIAEYELSRRNNYTYTLIERWKDVYANVFRTLSEIVMFREDTFSIRLFHVKEHKDWRTELKLYAEIMIFPNSGRFAIPSFIYSEDNEKDITLIEWKCGYCQTPNRFMDKDKSPIVSCQKCGAMRPMLLQEV